MKTGHTMKATRPAAIGVLIIAGFGLLAWSRIQHGGRVNPDLRDILVFIAALLVCYGAEKVFEGTFAWTVVGWTAAVLVSIWLGYWVAAMLWVAHIWAFWVVLGVVCVLGIVTFWALQAIATLRC